MSVSFGEPLNKYPQQCRQGFFEWAGSLCGRATPWALPGYTCRFYYLVQGIWKPSGLLCLFRTGLPKAEEISF